MPSRVFVSYRRTDSGPWVSRITTRLEEVLGADSVFYDLTGVPLGAKLKPFLAAHVVDCAIVLALIGPDWLATLNERRRRGEADHVALELQVALEFKKGIVPVLLDGAAMPRESELPASLVGLAERAASTITPETFEQDMARLTDGVEHLIELVEQERAQADAIVGMTSDGRPKLTAKGNVFDGRPIRVNQAPLRAAYRDVSGKSKEETED